MIIGVTHDSGGRVIQRLSVSTKLAIGLPPNGDRNYPTKLDHFVFLRKKRTTKGVEWELDPELTEHYGKGCREVRIVLIDDDVENIFPTSYAWWTAVERKCWGDGTSATRRTPEKPGGQPWTPCGSGCPELASGLCKPSGDLRFVLADFPRLGSVCRIHTSSYRSIRQIHSALQEIQGFTGGRLAGLTAKLVVRPEEAAYFDAKDNRKKSTTIWALSLEVDGADMQKLVSNLTENARVFAETRKLLGGGRVIEVVEDEEEQAPELAKEFYLPASATSSPGGVTGAARVSDSVNGPDHSHDTLPPAPLIDKPSTKPPLREPQRRAAQTSAQGSGAAKQANLQAPAGAAEGDQVNAIAGDSRGDARPDTSSNHQPAKPQKPTGSIPKGTATTGDGQPKANVFRGIVGPLEPNESGNTLRHSSSGVDYVVFNISQKGSAATVYCNRPEMLPEIAQRQGREATAQVALIGNNGHSYCVLDHFVEG
ncbi:MAG TPA: hypothetical protein VGX94_01690 [Terriglobia bacterium]|nr:hypothetical protein [Terriglobia bacterium]